MPPKLNVKTKDPDGSAPSTPVETNAPYEGDARNAAEDCEGVVSEGGAVTRSKRGKTRESRGKKMCKGNDEKACGKPVLDDKHGGIECEICLLWYHPACQNMTNDAYQAVRQHSLFWICLDCRKSVPLFQDLACGKHAENSARQINSAHLTQIEKKIDALNKIVTDQSTLVREIVPTVDGAKKLYADAVKQCEGKEGQQMTSREAIQDCFEKCQKEKEELEKRKCNIAVSNLPESQAASGEERKQEDIALLTDIIKEELKICVKVENSFRVGKRLENKPRMLIVKLESEAIKWDVLKMAKVLRESENEMIKNVYINKDLTLQEREKNKKLREELKQRRAQGENVIISKGKCVTIKRQQENDGKVTACASTPAVDSGATQA